MERLRRQRLRGVTITLQQQQRRRREIIIIRTKVRRCRKTIVGDIQRTEGFAVIAEAVMVQPHQSAVRATEEIHKRELLPVCPITIISNIDHLQSHHQQVPSTTTTTDDTDDTSVNNHHNTSAVDEARNLSNTLRKNEKAIGKKISRALSTPHLATNDNNNHQGYSSSSTSQNNGNNNAVSATNDPNQSDSYEEIVLGDKNNANNNYSHSSYFSRNNAAYHSARQHKSYIARDRIHSFSASTTTSSTSSNSTAYHENGACCAQLSEQQQQLHHTHVHCQHHHSHRQDIPYDSNESDDNNFLNAAVDNCGVVSNYATLNLDDQEIEKYFVNISSNFSRNSSIRRSVRNFSGGNGAKSSTASGTSRRTTPASSNRASPYIFDQLSNTVTCLKPKRATYYSDTSYSSMSSRNSTLTRNPSKNPQMGSSNSVNGQKPFLNIDNLTYYESTENQQSRPQQQQQNGRQVPDLKWNFLSDLRKEKEKQQRERRKSDISQMHTQTMHRRKKDEYWKLRKSAQNVNNISIWCAENDERNAIIFHHESEVVENCCGNMYYFPQYLADDQEATTKSTDVLNNTFDARSKMSGSLQNMQHNVFSRSSSNVYNITDEFKVFEKQSNLTRDSINLSHNYIHSLSSSHSSLYTAANHLANHNLNKVLNTSRTSSAAQGPSTSSTTPSSNPNNVENNLSYNFSAIQYEKPSHLQSLTAQNQLQQMEIDNGYFTTETSSHINNSSSTEAMLSNAQTPWRSRVQDPVGMRSIFRTIRNVARRVLTQTDAKNKKNHKNMN
ncbi:uncharacterized protein DDB_G0283357-like [Culicoides brevitarsis]|uniref:uncharacterized protein DDB_G0283357-like n=1 Tax=Culicoides brevitarsis TaxID=469753 RepID=UPI00307C3084